MSNNGVGVGVGVDGGISGGSVSPNDNPLEIHTHFSGSNDDDDDDDDSFQLQLIETNDDDDKAALLEEEEFAKIASPKVSELLKEQAIVLDELLWNGYYSHVNSSDTDNSENDEGDEDGIDEEWRQLEATQLNLKDELEAATKMYYDNSQYHDSDKSLIDNDDGDCDQSWSDSIHQYYIGSSNSNNSIHHVNDTSPLHSSIKNDDSSPPPPPPPINHSYTLADHARASHISRRESDRGVYTMPFLSRHDLETMDIVSLPEWISRPSSTGGMSSRERELYMKRILDCAVEYIEPMKSKKLRKLFSGWVPGPGEGQSSTRRDGSDDVNGQGVAMAAPYRGSDSQRIVAYHSKAQKSNDDDDNENDGDSSCNEDENGYGFEDINGVTYASPSHKQPSLLEPLPVRTVTIRIRCDVMCGAVMDALTTSVERIDGEITKRQGGHLRAVLRGRAIRARKPGESENTIPAKNEDVPDDASTITTGFSTILSPLLRSPRTKHDGPSFDILPPYILDAQLVTKKVGKECQRLVLLRIYRMQDVARASAGMGEGDNEEEFDALPPLYFAGEGEEGVDHHDDGGNECIIDLLQESNRSLRSLQEAAALVQRIKAVGGSGFAIDPPQPTYEGDAASISSNSGARSYLKSFGDVITSPIRYLAGMQTSRLSPNTTVMELMSAELLRKLVPSPSVGTVSKSAFDAAKKKSYGVFPALSKEDEPYVKSSWIFLRDCIEELDRRCLAHSTLGMYHSMQGNYTSFQFPPLPTLDGHFIAQINAFCRESMIVSLVKTASELEIYAREFERSCGNLDQLLRPTFDMYRITPPQLPVPVPLTAYPLDFRAPEEICPPWGPDVQASLDGLESIFDQSHVQLSGFECSEKAVSAVVAAFQKQNDVEQGARLGRKNMQVMDRLAKMQAHKRNSIARLRDSYGISSLATKAANEFHALRQRSTNIGSLTDVINSVPDEVPLLICNVLVGNAAGTCYVTHAHVLFSTQLLPVLGGSRIHLFSIMDIEVTINAQSNTLLSPLPASISFTTAVFGSRRSTREEVYNFIPSVGARRFAKFIEVLRDVASENPESLKFSERGGLMYLAA